MENMTTIINFEKFTGAGNDFILINDFEYKLSDDFYQDVCSLLCSRGFGIGSDGLMVIRKSDKYDFKMMYWNPDGSIAGMCGNGGRCISMLYSKNTGKKQISFETRSGIYSAKILAADQVELTMINPFDFIDETPAPQPSGYANTGTQHWVISETDLENLDVNSVGRKWRNHQFALSKGGSNINFVKPTGQNSIKVRTYEKGVEAETLACGTGTVAAALISYRKAIISQKPVQVQVQSGEILTVGFDDQFQNVTLTGQAKFLFSGTCQVQKLGNQWRFA